MSVASSVYLSLLCAESHTLSTKSLGQGQMLSCPMAGQQIRPQPLNLQPSSAHPHSCRPSPSPPQLPRCARGAGGSREGCWRGASAAPWLSPVTLPGHGIGISISLRLYLSCTFADISAELPPAFGGVSKGDTTAFTLCFLMRRDPLAASVAAGEECVRVWGCQ